MLNYLTITYHYKSCIYRPEPVNRRMKWQHCHMYSVWLIWVIFLICFVIYFLVAYRHPLKRTKRDRIDCYRIKNVNTLPNIANHHPKPGMSIFFHETSCTSFIKRKIWITSRQACAVESAAMLNPSLDIYLLFTSPTNFRFEREESDQFLKVLLTYPNVKIMHLDYENYTKGTPVEKLYSSGLIERSRYKVSHSSDVLRYLTLWKYGGIYIDLDVVILKPLDALKINYAGVQGKGLVAAGVLHFEAAGYGHELAERCLVDLKNNFNRKTWSKNGPGVITRLLQQLCGVKKIEKNINNECGGFTAYPSNIFYPVSYNKWKMYFEDKFLDAVKNMTQDSYAIHTWNKFSKNTKIPLKANAPYLYFARKFCPKIVNACENVF